MSEAELPRKRLALRITILTLVIVVPIGCHLLYRHVTDLPKRVRIARGLEGGRYREVTDAIGMKLNESTGVRLEYVDSQGSLESLRLLESGEVDFALVQPELRRFHPDDSPRVQSVANMFLEVVHVLVREQSDITDANGLRGRHVAMGLKNSGDFAASLMVVEHLGLLPDEPLAHAGNSDVESRLAAAEAMLQKAELTPDYLDYSSIGQRFREAPDEVEKPLEAAIVTLGIDAPFLRRIAGERHARVVPIPYSEALATRQLSCQPYTIPAGMYATSPDPVPPEPVETVAVRAQLLTRNDVPDNLVEEVTRVVMNSGFQKRNRLRELLGGGQDFAHAKTGFRIHEGALHFFDPELKPLLPTDFVEATEGLRSFVVSVLIALWLFLRWFRENRLRGQEHRLDRYIHLVLEIEQKQMDFDQDTGSDDIESLQLLLDEVTQLRQEALGELTAHELKQHSAADSFIQMCHALTEKINAKLTRQRFDARLMAIERRLNDNADEQGNNDG